MLGRVFMNRRALIMLASLWTLLVAPNLCTIGMLTHACEEHDSDGCGHETDCSDDPCAKSASPGFLALRATWQDAAHQPLDAVRPDALAPRALPAARLKPQPHPPRGTSPAPGEGLPLLI